MNEIDEQKKILIEELLFHEIGYAHEYYLIGRILRKLQETLQHHPEWIVKNIPAHKDKLLSLKSDLFFLHELQVDISTLVSNYGKGEPKLPRRCAEIYYRILEYCKDSKSNYEWFREYIRADGKLLNRLKSSNVKIHFELPIVPLAPQDDTDWARILKKNLLMSLSTFMPNVKVPKSHNGRTKKVQLILNTNNDEFFINVQQVFKSQEIKIDYTSTIELFLSGSYRGEEDLKILEYDFLIDRKFR